MLQGPRVRPSTFRRSGSACSLSLFLVLLFASVDGFAESFESDEPAMVKSGSLEDHEARTEDPDDLRVRSREMVETESEDPDTMRGAAEEADVVESSVPAAHEGRSTALQDLGTARPDQGFEPIDDGRLEGIVDSHLNAEQLLAKRRLEHAQSNAEAAVTRYGDMMRDNYPRGAARERIVDARDAAMNALGDARRQFDAAMAP